MQQFPQRGCHGKSEIESFVTCYPDFHLCLALSYRGWTTPIGMTKPHLFRWARVKFFLQCAKTPTLPDCTLSFVPSPGLSSGADTYPDQHYPSSLLFCQRIGRRQNHVANQLFPNRWARGRSTSTRQRRLRLLSQETPKARCRRVCPQIAQSLGAIAVAIRFRPN